MHVITALHGGGAERLLTNVVLRDATPEETVIVSLLPGGVFRVALESAGFTVIDLGMRSSFGAIAGLFRLAALMRKWRPNVVQAWMYHANFLALLALRLAGLRGTRLVWGAFCTDIPKRDLTLALARRANVLLSRYVDHVVYNAEEARDFHHALGFREPRSSVISNSIDANVFRHDSRKRTELRRQLGIAEETIVVAVVARVDPMKDWETLRDAVRGLPVVMLAIGKGTDAMPPQEGFVGLGWRDDVPEVLSAADIFLLGSAFGEGLSLALGEAMLCGLPCIVTRVGGNASFASDAAIVVEPRDVEAMRAAILQLAAHPEQRRRLGHRARELAAAAYAHDGNVAQLPERPDRIEAVR